MKISQVNKLLRIWYWIWATLIFLGSLVILAWQLNYISHYKIVEVETVKNISLIETEKLQEGDKFIYKHQTYTIEEIKIGGWNESWGNRLSIDIDYE